MTEFNVQHTFKIDNIPCQEVSNQAVLINNPLVSIIIITYNHERYIAKAIEGVLQQKTDFTFELIIGEDCSTDDTSNIVLDYQKRYPQIVRVITSEKNVGARKNSFRVRKACRGKYIADCEGDDYWHDTNKLQMQVNFLENNLDYGMAFTNADSLDVTTGTRIKFAIPVRPELCQEDDPYLQQLTGAIIIWPLTTCVRTQLSLEILEECPELTDPTYAMGDTQRFLEIARRTKVKYMPVSTATRNLLPESATRSQSIIKRANFVASSQRLILHYLHKYPLSTDKDREVRNWVAKRAIYYAYLCQDKDKAETEMAILKSLGDDVHWKYNLYAFGSRNSFRHHIVSLIFKAMSKIVTVRKHIILELKSLGGDPGIGNSRLN